MGRKRDYEGRVRACRGVTGEGYDCEGEVREGAMRAWEVWQGGVRQLVGEAEDG